MPLYEYECTACHRRTEKIQKFSDAELTICPYCGERLERTITAAAVSFKGGGWYKDGYASAKPATGAGGNDTAAASAATDSGAASPAAGGSGESAKPAAAPGSGAGPASSPAPAAAAPAASAKA